VTPSIAVARSAPRALLSALRPRQWVKNGLIIVAPAAAGRLFHPRTLRDTVLAFVAFCAVSSGIYLLNDLRDRPQDQRHPTKRYRAIAAGQLGTRTALVASVVAGLVGFGVALAVPRPGELLEVLGVYLAISLAYVSGVKNIAVWELGAVASGFFLRAYAGAVATGVSASRWFLVVVSFGALFLVVGKRLSELGSVEANTTRKVLADYSRAFLTSALTLSATVVVTGYCLWAFDTSSAGLSANHDATLPVRLSVVPVVLAMLSLLRGAEAGRAESPEELVLRDHTIQLLLVVWIILVALGVYV